MGRPSTFTQEMADKICEKLSEGVSLTSMCKLDEFPAASTVYKWLIDVPGFSEQYAHARDAQADFLAEQILDIADDGSDDTFIDKNGNERTDQEVIGRSKLRVDARKWYVGKLRPKKYGERVQQDVNIAKSPRDMSIEELQAAITVIESQQANGKD